MSSRKRYASAAEYIADAVPQHRSRLRQIRALVKREVPDAVETISYNIPAFRLGKVFFYYAAFKDHISVFPPVRGNRDLAKKLKPYLNAKGNILISASEPLPLALLSQVAKHLASQYAVRRTHR